MALVAQATRARIFGYRLAERYTAAHQQPEVTAGKRALLAIFEDGVPKRIRIANGIANGGQAFRERARSQYLEKKDLGRGRNRNPRKGIQEISSSSAQAPTGALPPAALREKQVALRQPERPHVPPGGTKGHNWGRQSNLEKLRACSSSCVLRRRIL